MKLRFFAVGDVLVPMRNPDGSSMPRNEGQFARYVGRDLMGAVIRTVAASPGVPEHVVREHTPAISGDPHECDLGSGEAEYCAAQARAGHLAPADKATADAIGVPLPVPVKTSQKGGE